MAARQPHRTKPRPGKSPYFTRSPRTTVAQIDSNKPHLPIFLPGTTDEEKTERRAPFMELFFIAFREHGTQNPACIAANINRSTVTEWLRANVDGFRDRYQEAQKDVNDKVEREIVRRGVEGYEEPVFQGGKEVGTIRKFSDQLLIFFAKARMPERYRDKFEGANLIGGDQYNIQMVRNDVLNVISQMPEEELERLAGRGRPDGNGFPQIGDGKTEPDQTDTPEGEHGPGEPEVVEGEVEVVDAG